MEPRGSTWKRPSFKPTTNASTSCSKVRVATHTRPKSV